MDPWPERARQESGVLRKDNMNLQVVSHVGLACRDPRVTERFYQQFFGFRRARVVPLPGGDEIVFLKMQDCAFYLELFRGTQSSPVPPAVQDGPWYPGFRHLAFKVPDVEAKLAEIGEAARITQGPASFDDFIPGWKTAWIADPDGMILEISQGFTDQLSNELVPPQSSTGSTG
jgi:glyoxylase I family protein